MDVDCRCGKFMGTVEAGSKLRKGWTVLCVECEEKFKKLEAAAAFATKTGYTGKNPFGDIFGDIFSSGFKGPKK